MNIMCIIMLIIFAFFIFEGAVCSRTITSRVKKKDMEEQQK